MLRIMLKAHEDISNPGEGDFLFDYLHPSPDHPSGWSYDKKALAHSRSFRVKQLDLPDQIDGLDLLNNMLAQLDAKHAGLLTLNVHRHAEKIIKAMPEASFIHLLRDPRDVARSSIGMGWSGTVYQGVNHWVETESSWDKIVHHIPEGRYLDIKYELLVTEPESILRRICDFLGVTFDSAMLDYHGSSSYGPPDPSLVEQWRRRARGKETALIEGKAGYLMRARGYSPEGSGYKPGVAEHVFLVLVDRIRVWRFGVERYGAFVYLSEKFTRWLRLVEINRRLRRQMQDIGELYLK